MISNIINVKIFQYRVVISEKMTILIMRFYHANGIAAAIQWIGGK